MKKVQVLLSTYNGENYLKEQIESILKQTYSNTTLLIRDDGSTDTTASIIEKFISNYPDRIQFIQGSNVGVIKSFFLLLQHSDSDAHFYCFCDQDDVWIPSKIERALTMMHSLNKYPSMVFTATQMVDSKLEPLNIWPTPSKKPSFYNALVQNIAVGATISINKMARNLLISKQPDTTQILMHDWWAYLTISAFGVVKFDSEPTILYRQHGKNAIGGPLHFRDMLKRKWKSFRKHQGSHLLTKQAMEFKRLFGCQLNESKLNQLNLFVTQRHSLLARVKFLTKTRLYRQSFFEQTLFRFLILIGYI